MFSYLKKSKKELTLVLIIRASLTLLGITYEGFCIFKSISFLPCLLPSQTIFRGIKYVSKQS